MSKVNYALIGFGGIAENRIAKEGFGLDAERVGRPKLAELVGVTDVNPARKDVALKLGLKWYENTDAVLADDRGRPLLKVHTMNVYNPDISSK